MERVTASGGEVGRLNVAGGAEVLLLRYSLCEADFFSLGSLCLIASA